MVQLARLLLLAHLERRTTWSEVWPLTCPAHMSRAAGLTVGRTPLIKLSPKKTWEGFIGGAVVTLVASWYLAGFMSRYKWMTCERNVRAVPRVCRFARPEMLKMRARGGGCMVAKHASSPAHRMSSMCSR